MTTYTKIDHNNDLSQCLHNCEKIVIDPSKSLFKAVKFWIKRAHQRRQLGKLDQRILEDIGVSRVAANREIAKPFWR